MILCVSFVIWAKKWWILINSILVLFLFNCWENFSSVGLIKREQGSTGGAGLSRIGKFWHLSRCEVQKRKWKYWKYHKLDEKRYKGFVFRFIHAMLAIYWSEKSRNCLKAFKVTTILNCDKIRCPFCLKNWYWGNLTRKFACRLNERTSRNKQSEYYPN